MSVDDAFRTSQWTWSKSFDDTTPFGPVIVSAKAIPDPQKLPLKAEVNGKTLQDSNTAYGVISILRRGIDIYFFLPGIKFSTLSRRLRSSHKVPHLNLAH